MSTLKIGDTVQLNGALILRLPDLSTPTADMSKTVECTYYTPMTNLVVTNLFLLSEEIDPEQDFPLMANVIDPATGISATISTAHLIPVKPSNYATPDAKCVQDDEDEDDPIETTAPDYVPNPSAVIARDEGRCVIDEDDEEEDD